MPRSKHEFEEMRKATRRKIQSAAMQLFVQKGYGSTNVQDIADAAGISIGLLYRHYKNKESLFHELVEFALAGLKDNISSFESNESPKKILEKFINEIYNDMLHGEELANLMILMTQSFFSGGGSNSQQGEALQVNASLLNATAMLISRGQKMGEFRSGNAYEMAVFFYAAIQGLAEMKVILKNNFAMPSPSILTAFLYEEGE